MRWGMHLLRPRLQLLLCCFVAFYLNATAMQSSCGEEQRDERVHRTIYFGFHTHTHTLAHYCRLPQQCGSHSSVKQCAVKIFTRINDMQLILYVCVWHILKASMAISILIMNISVARQMRGRGGCCRDSHSFKIPRS